MLVELQRRLLTHPMWRGSSIIDPGGGGGFPGTVPNPSLGVLSFADRGGSIVSWIPVGQPVAGSRVHEHFYRSFHQVLPLAGGKSTLHDRCLAVENPALQADVLFRGGQAK